MAETLGTAYIQIEPSAKGIDNKIKTELGAAGEAGGKSFGNGFASVLGGVTKVTLGAVAAGATAVGGIVTSAVKSFGDYEQLAGGIETLFGDSAQTVIDNADRAFQSAGLSANDYMETSIQSAAALINSLEGDTSQAADLMDMSITDMADNVNKMGTNMQSVQDAYRGFSRGNFTMLDNLALGFAGTKEGMQQLLDQAEKISGVKYDISSYSDIVKAIHTVQEEMGITGTTSKEAADTIQGSLSAMKAAWENTMTAIANGDGWNMGVYIENLVDSVKTFAGNVMPVVQSALVGVSELIQGLGPEIAAAIPDLVTQVLPGLLDAGASIIQTLADGILQAIPELMPAVTDIIMQLVDMLIQMLPQLIEVGMQIILQLSLGIAQALPTLIPAIVDVMLTIVEYLTDNVDLLVEAAVAIISGLTEGFIAATPILIARVPEIMIKIAEALVTNLPILLNAVIENLAKIGEVIKSYAAPYAAAAGNVTKQAINAVIGFLKDLPTKMAYYAGRAIGEFIKFFQQLPSKVQKIFSELLQALKQFGQNFVTQAPIIVKDFVSKFIDNMKSLPKQMVDIGKQIVDGVWTGIKNAWGSLKENFMKLIQELLKGVKDSLKIKSPSRVFADEVGKMIPLGIAQGIQDGMRSLTDITGDMSVDMVGTAQKTMAASASTVQSSGGYQAGNSSAIYDLLSKIYGAVIDGKNINIYLEGDADRLFRVMQAQAARNTQLVGV